jgi:hypothetical protein
MRKRVKERLTTTENKELFPSEVHGARAGARSDRPARENGSAAAEHENRTAEA